MNSRPLNTTYQIKKSILGFGAAASRHWKSGAPNLGNIDDRAIEMLERFGLKPPRIWHLQGCDNPSSWQEYRENLPRYNALSREERRHYRRKSKGEKPEDIDRPNDYELASSMHQPFESRLKSALSI